MPFYEHPLRVDGERVWRTWLGGRELDKLHGAAEPKDDFFPEEWIISTTRANNVGREDIEEGLCYLADAPVKTSLKQAIEGAPEKMLGIAHAAEYGASEGVLVKLLDSLVRLAIQVHPDQPTAKRLFNSRFGKTEGWHVLSLRENEGLDPCLYLGFREGVTRADLEACFHSRDYAGMLALFNRIVPKPGETYIVHGGVPHAIGPGCFFVEIQEPTDLTIRLEKVLPYGLTLDDMALHNGIGFERMFDCFHYEGVSEAEAKARWRVEPKTLAQTDACLAEELVGYETTPCFKMERLTVRTAMAFSSPGVFSGLYILSGEGAMEYGGEILRCAPNDQFFIPAASRDFTLRNTGREPLKALRFYGPKVD